MNGLRACIFRLFVALSVYLMLASTAHAAYLATGAPVAVSGGYQIPIALFTGNGEAVASLQCTVLWPESVQLEHVSPGAAASAAGKDVVYALRGRSATVIIAGFNQTIIGGGVVAVATVSVKDGVAPQLQVANVVFSDPRGGAIAQLPPPTNTSPDPAPESPPVEDKQTPEPVINPPAATPDGSGPGGRSLIGGPGAATDFGVTPSRAEHGARERASQYPSRSASESALGARPSHAASVQEASSRNPMSSVPDNDTYPLPRSVAASGQTRLPRQSEVHSSARPYAPQRATNEDFALPVQVASAASQSAGRTPETKPLALSHAVRELPPQTYSIGQRLLLSAMLAILLLLLMAGVWRMLRRP